MMFATFLLLQAMNGLSTLPPAQDEQLRFIFPAASVAGDARISGTAAAPAEHSRQAYHRLVEQCGGKGIGVVSDSPRYIVLSARSTADNLNVAQCVKQSTGARFDVGVRRLDYKSGNALDRQPFAELWDRKLASNRAR